jgi:hypothetical protein
VYHSLVERLVGGLRSEATWTRTWQRAFAASAVAWVIVLPLAAYAASRPHGGAAAFGFAYGAYAIGHVICHQLPERSFHLWAAALPVCARCTGIYVGAAIVAAWAFIGGRLGRPGRGRGEAGGPSPMGVSPQTARMLLTAAVLPTAATLVYEWTTGHMPANAIRAMAGLPIGAAVAWIVGEVN